MLSLFSLFIVFIACCNNVTALDKNCGCYSLSSKTLKGNVKQIQTVFTFFNTRADTASAVIYRRVHFNKEGLMTDMEDSNASLGMKWDYRVEKSHFVYNKDTLVKKIIRDTYITFSLPYTAIISWQNSNQYTESKYDAKHNILKTTKVILNKNCMPVSSENTEYRDTGKIWAHTLTKTYYDDNNTIDSTCTTDLKLNYTKTQYIKILSRDTAGNVTESVSVEAKSNKRIAQVKNTIEYYQ